MGIKDILQTGCRADEGIKKLIDRKRVESRPPADASPGPDDDPRLVMLPPGGVTEHLFARPRKWRLDFAWVAAKIALEVEGGLFGCGKKCPTCGRRSVAGHSSVQRIKTDMEKYNAASTMGWRVLRCTPDELNNGKAFTLVANALRQKAREYLLQHGTDGEDDGQA